MVVVRNDRVLKPAISQQRSPGRESGFKADGEQETGWSGSGHVSATRPYKSNAASLVKGKQGNSTGDILTKEKKQTQWKQEELQDLQ